MKFRVKFCCLWTSFKVCVRVFARVDDRVDARVDTRVDAWVEVRVDISTRKNRWTETCMPKLPMLMQLQQK